VLAIGYEFHKNVFRVQHAGAKNCLACYKSDFSTKEKGVQKKRYNSNNNNSFCIWGPEKGEIPGLAYLMAQSENKVTFEQAVLFVADSAASSHYCWP